jgi:hypothetical protein
MTGVKISALPAANAANDTDQLEVNQNGVSRRVTVGQIATHGTGEFYLPSFGEISTAAGFADALNAAAVTAGLAGGGVINIPAGTWSVGVPVANRVATNEGATLILTSAMSNIVFRGAGKGVTVLRPASNKIEMFAQYGAANVAFEGITFDNSGNGPLQNQVKQASLAGPSTGIAGQGNAANCAIRQYEGAGLTVRNCEFREWLIAIEYIGSFADDQVLAGDLICEGCRFDGCAQGILPSQPATIRFTGWDYSNGIDSVNADASVDPGHGLYLTNRAGAYPRSVVVSDFTATNTSSSPCKIRKGDTVTVSNFALDLVQRGVEVNNCRALAVSNGSVRLATVSVIDTNCSGIEMTDCGNCEISNVVIDKSGTVAWGVRIVATEATHAWQNTRSRVSNITMLDDFAGGTGKDFIVCTGQSDMEIVDVVAHVTANVSNTRAVINVTDGTRIHIIRPKRRAATAGSPTGSDRLVVLGASATGCTVEYARQDLDVTPTANTVTNAGTGNTILRVDGAQSSTYLPVASFATNGDFAPTYARQHGYWVRNGDIAQVFVSLVFTANAYTTAAGTFQMSLPFTAASSATMALWGVGNGNFQNITFSSGVDMEVLVAAGASNATLRTSLTASVGSALGVANIPASATSVNVTFQITYKIVEP